MRDLASLTIPAARLTLGQGPWTEALAVIDLDRESGAPGDFRLPACPAIGIGDPGHPLANALDAVIEPPVSLDRVVGQVLQRPMAAATVVALLRMLPGLPIGVALAAESLAYATLQGSAEHRAWLASTERRARRGEGRVALAREDGRLTVTLDDPGHGNAIDRPMRDALHEAFALAALDPEIEAIVLRANGRSFSLGAELSEFGTTTDPATAHRIRALTLPAHMAALCGDRLEVHVQGACVGAGLELAAWGRRVTAQADAWFQLPELAMGVLPGAGGCVSLTRRIGRQRTALLVLSGKRINARQALAWGLVDEIVGRAEQSGADIV